MLEQERQRIEQLTAGWDDPTQVDWGPEDSSEPPPASESTAEVETTVVASVEPTVPVYKCTALYTYTVSAVPFLP